MEWSIPEISNITPAPLPVARQGEAILARRATPVPEAGFNTPALLNLTESMRLTMLAANGVGIAAPQVFVPLRIMIVASRPNPRYPDAPLMEPVVMINPEIRWRSGQCDLAEEGCLSVPEQRGMVRRASRLRVWYRDPGGVAHETAYSGFAARIVQHEHDHLEGILFVERLE
ncbi:MAG: peptide deformylase [Thiothrix sp.]|nr:peptide deformylase [Thiothrix sp.]